MNINIETTLCFTGHRPSKLKGYNPNDNKDLLFHLRDIIEYHIENHNIDTFITGMALGIDQWAAKIVLKLKLKYPHIKLVAAIPCANHSSKWNNDSKLEWKYIADNCDYVHYVSDELYTHWCMNKRNEWMVDNSSYVIAVHDGTEGGTNNCKQYAIKSNKNVVTVHPKTLEVD